MVSTGLLAVSAVVEEIQQLTISDRLSRLMAIAPSVLIFFAIIILVLEIRALRIDLLRLLERLSGRGV